MVCFGGERLRVARRAESEVAVMETMGMEKQKVPLHNFELPCSWGSQKQLRCMKVTAHSSYGAATDRGRRSNRSPMRSLEEEGIEELREKIMMDFKTAADRMKHELLRKSQQRVLPRADDKDENDDEESASKSRSRSPPRRSPEVEKEKEEETKPWNLRTRRAACKSPAAAIGGKVVVENNSNSSLGKSEMTKSPRPLRGGGEKREREEKEVKEKEKRRPKFSVGLSKKEIEVDFMEIVGHRPARRPKKRPRAVQKQIDALFPGMWLTEVTADMYTVPEVPDNGKR